MVKEYLEVLETVPVGQEGDFIRVDITDMTSQEVTIIQGSLRDLMSSKTYVATLHTCHHDEAVPRACQSTIVVL